jgi:hypothetical protein
MFKSIFLTILKWLRFKAVSWRHDFQPCTVTVWDGLIVGLLWFHHIQSLVNLTMVTNAYNLLYDKKDIKAGMLPWQPELVAHRRANTVLKVLLALSINHVWIYFEPLCRFSLNLVGK